MVFEAMAEELTDEQREGARALMVVAEQLHNVQSESDAVRFWESLTMPERESAVRVAKTYT